MTEEQEKIEEEKVENSEPVRSEAEEYKANWQRALADYRNLQKETAVMRSQWAQMSEENILQNFIPVYEHLKLAINNEQLASNKNPWLEGVRHVTRQFAGVLKSYGVEEIKTVGEKFDPHWHEAVSALEPESQGDSVQGKIESGTILREVEGGYKKGDKVIKPARVIISK